MSDRERCGGRTRSGQPCDLHRFGGVPHSGPCRTNADLTRLARGGSV